MRRAKNPLSKRNPAAHDPPRLLGFDFDKCIKCMDTCCETGSRPALACGAGKRLAGMVG